MPGADRCAYKANSSSAQCRVHHHRSAQRISSRIAGRAPRPLRPDLQRPLLEQARPRCRRGRSNRSSAIGTRRSSLAPRASSVSRRARPARRSSTTGDPEQTGSSYPKGGSVALACPATSKCIAITNVPSEKPAEKPPRKEPTVIRELAFQEACVTFNGGTWGTPRLLPLQAESPRSHVPLLRSAWRSVTPLRTAALRSHSTAAPGAALSPSRPTQVGSG